MTTKRTGTGLVLTVALMAAGVAGCTDDTTGTPSTGTSTPSAAATATPSVDPNDPQAVAYATATALFEEYFEQSQELRQKPGMPDWENILGYTSGEVRANNTFWYTYMEEQGRYQRGEARIVSSVPTSYQGHPEGNAAVTLDVCIDSSDSDTPGWVGDPTKSKPDEPDRVLLTYTILAFPQEGGGLVWAINRAEIQEGESC